MGEWGGMRGEDADLRVSRSCRGRAAARYFSCRSRRERQGVVKGRGCRDVVVVVAVVVVVVVVGEVVVVSELVMVRLRRMFHAPPRAPSRGTA